MLGFDMNKLHQAFPDEVKPGYADGLWHITDRPMTTTDTKTFQRMVFVLTHSAEILESIMHTAMDAVKVTST